MPDETTTTTTTNEDTTSTTTVDTSNGENQTQESEAETLSNDQSDQNVTTTTSVDPNSDQASANHPGGDASPMAERQGEVVADQGADTNVLGGDNPDDDQTQANNLAQAKTDAISNHNAEQERAQS